MSDDLITTPFGFDSTAAEVVAGVDLSTVEQGATTSTLLAASPLLDGVSGRYFEDCNEARVVHRRGGPGRGGVAPYALDPENGARLWDLSLQLTS